MKKNHKGKILNIETIAKDTIKMQFTTELKKIFPGQFISILIPDKTLRRPFSVADFTIYRADNITCNSIFEHTSEISGIITVLFKIKGDGTNYLKSLKIGDIINYLAPLGNTFTLPAKGKKALLIGAGIGIAPMLYLKKILEQNEVETFLISGFKDEKEAIEGSNKTIIGGSVLDNIQELINEFKPEILYSCGPEIVLQMVCKIAEKNKLKAQIAMEKVMACGIGVCRGCVIKLKNKNEIKNASVCADGPVFNGSEVIWED